MNLKHLKPGDDVLEVIIPFSRIVRRDTRVLESKVESVGRRWLRTTIGGKFDVETGHGDYSRELHTRQSLDDALDRAEAIDWFRDKLNYWKPFNGVSTATLKAARDLIEERTEPDGV